MSSYNPHHPHIDTTTNRTADLLRARGIDPDRLGETENPDLDAHDRNAVISRALDYTAKRIPRHYRAAMPEQPEVRAWVTEVATRATGPVVPLVKHGPSLLLVGPTGTGKTYAAYAAMRDLACTGVTCRWIAIPAADLYANLRPRTGVDSETEFRRYADADVLVVDDLGAAKNSEFTEEVNYRLVNHRYEDERPTIFTSNVRPSQLGEALGERVASRLIEMCQRVTLKGADRRRQAAA